MVGSRVEYRVTRRSPDRTFGLLPGAHLFVAKSCLAKARCNPKPLRETGRMVTWRTNVELGDAERGSEDEAPLQRSTCLLDLAEMSQRGSEIEVNERGDIPVGLGRALEPLNGSFVIPEI